MLYGVGSHVHADPECRAGRDVIGTLNSRGMSPDTIMTIIGTRVVPVAGVDTFVPDTRKCDIADVELPDGEILEGVDTIAFSPAD